MNPAPDTTTGDRAFAVDAAAIAVVSVAIGAASDALVFMSLFVPAVVAMRCFLWRRLAEDERGGAVAAEVVLFSLCTVLGAFNDWNSVVGHRIYDYTVPHFFPSFSTIPLWMLLYWGMILRFFVSLSRWRRLGAPAAPSNTVRVPGRVLDSPLLKVSIALALVAVTRQMIYRWFLDPVLSWLPFAVALVVFAALFRPDRHDRRLMLLALIGGPLIEIFYIQVGGLHRYHLGWIGGVPLWIALWWVIVVPIWKDLTLRLSLQLAGSAVLTPTLPTPDLR